MCVGQFVKLSVFYDVFGVEFGPQWVDVEERILPMVYLGRRLLVLALKTLVAYGRQVHVSSLLSDLDALEPMARIWNVSGQSNK